MTNGILDINSITTTRMGKKGPVRTEDGMAKERYSGINHSVRETFLLNIQCPELQ